MKPRLASVAAFGASALTTLIVGTAVPTSALVPPVQPPEVKPDVEVEIDKNSGVVGDDVRVTYTMSNLDRVTDFSHQFPAGLVSAAQVLSATTCPVAVFPTAATASAGAKVRVLFDGIPDTPCKVVIGATASSPGEFALGSGFTSTTLGTRVVGDDAGDYTFSAPADPFVAHDPTKPTVTLSVDETADPEDGQVTSALLGESQVLTYSITGRPYGTEHAMSFTHELPAGLALDQGDEATAIVADTCYVAGTPGGRALTGGSTFPGGLFGRPGNGSAAVAADGVITLADGYLAGTDSDEASSCEIKVRVKPSQAGPMNHAAGFAVGATGTPAIPSLINGVTATSVYVSDPHVPTVTLSVDDSRVTLGDDIVLTYTATGMPYGTDQVDFSFADHSLSDMAQTYFAPQAIVSNTCGGNAQAFGVTGASLSAPDTGEVPSCELQVRWRALGAGHFDFGSNMILLNVANGIDPAVPVDVDPTLTMTVDEPKVVVGDDVRVTYTVDGGNSRGTNPWSWSQILPSGFDVATRVSDPCRLTAPTGGPRGFGRSAAIGNDSSGPAATTSMRGTAGALTRVDEFDQVTHSCSVTYDLHTSSAGHFDLGSGFTTSNVTDLIPATDIFVADPAQPTMTISTDETNVGLGDDVDVTFQLTGVPFGTPHTGLDFSLSDPLLDRGMATASLVSSTCGGTLTGTQITSASLAGTETDTPVECTTVMRLNMHGAAVLDVARAYGDEGGISSSYSPLNVTVRPSLTLVPNATRYKVGDTVKLTYNVGAGVWSNPSSAALPQASASTVYSYAQTLPGGIANPRVAVPSDAGCGNEFRTTATTITAGNDFATWSQFPTPKCTLVITATATKAGTFDISDGVSVDGLTNDVSSSSIHVADPTKPTVTMTTKGDSFTVGDDITLSYVVTGRPFGAPHTAMAITQALPAGIGTVTAGMNTCGGTLVGNAGTLTLTGGSLPGSETSAVPSCTFSATVDSATSGSFDVGTGLTTTVNDGLGETSIVVLDPAGFTAVPPARVLDTRNGTHVAAGSTTEIRVTGSNGVPSDATDVALNVAVDGPSAAGFLTVYPCGSARPNTSNVNFEAGETRSNGVVTEIGDGGKVCVFSSAAANIVVDVTGAMAPHQGDGFSAFAPVRALDTRTQTARPSTHEVIRLPLRGKYDVPADATSVVLNVTSTDAQRGGFLTVFPCDTAMPLASSLNFTTGRTIANSVVAKIGSTGEVCIYTSAPTHVVVDVNGAFSTTGVGRSWSPAASRILDTRSSVKVAGGSVTELTVAGRGGVPANATAVVLNVTAVDPAGSGFVTVYPCGTERPEVSNLNFVARQTVPNAVTVTVGAEGKVCVFTTQALHLVVDLNGSYAPR